MTSDDGEARTAPVTPAYATTEIGDGASPPRASASLHPGAALALPAAGYDLGDVIGRGGMGEVVTAHDVRIGREVAIKRMHATAPSANAIARFLREARVQARLDHPAIVPVYELGIDADGRPYFTMKRLSGVTLAQRLTEDGALQPLLHAFVDVCLAIEFAHSRSIVHRDLKPANIMLGEYGEVYVLDWGIARVLTERTRAQSQGLELDTLDEGTRAGELLGTPGFMAPEQVRGEAVGPPTDVYALGAILFELLAGEALHPRGTAALTMTLSAPQQGPALRRPERNIAPELDAACQAALAAAPGDRPTARELAERIQRYLDGDRDIERRRALAARELDTAHAALASGDPEARARAIHAAGRALALDPESTVAARLVTSLIVEPPRELPQQVVTQLAAEEQRASAARMRLGARALLAVLAFLVLLPWLQVKNLTTLAVFCATLVGVSAAFWFAARRGTAPIALSLGGSFALVLVFSRILGPFVLTPALISAMVVAVTANVSLNNRVGLVVAWLVACVFGPFVLEAVGLLRETWTLSADGLLSSSALLHGDGSANSGVLMAAHFGFLALVAAYALFTNRQVIDARRRLRIQAWHLGQLLPTRGDG